MLNRMLRYYPIVKYVNSKDPKNILEVGCGSYGIAEFCKRKIVGCDISFPDAPLENILPVYADCTKLPFESAAFDLVISLDMLEHIPSKDRKKAILELLRVSSSDVIIACPCGENAKIIDNYLARYYKSAHKEIPTWLIEHIETDFPEKDDIKQLLDEQRAAYTVINNENIYLHYLVMIGETVESINRIFIKFIKHLNFVKLLLFLNIGCPYRKIFYVKKHKYSNEGANEHKCNNTYV